MRTLTRQVAAAGVKMGKSLSDPMSKGLGAAKKSLMGLGGQLTGHIKTAATLGGALTFGSFVKDAVQSEVAMKDLAFTMKVMTGEARDWRNIQKFIQTEADVTSNKTKDMADAFQIVLDATKDPQFAFENLRTMGTHATGASKDVKIVASVVQMLRRQIGATTKEMPDLLASISELAKQGGPSFEDLAMRGDNLAAIMQQAGLKGIPGFKLMLGIMNEADTSMAGVGKQLTGLQVSLQKLRDVSTLQRMAKDLRIPRKEILKAENSFEAMKMILSKGEKGLLRFREEFKGPEAAKISKIYAAPFIEAYRGAKEEGIKEKKAVEIGLKALNDAFQKWSSTTMTHADVADRAAKRQQDADKRFEAAIDKMKQAFTKKEMTDAIDRLSEMLPKLANGFVKVLDLVTKHPALAIAGAVGAKAALAGTTAALGAGGKALLGGMGAKAAGAATVGAAATKAGLGVGLVGAGTVAAGAGAALAAGGAVGYGTFKLAAEPALNKGFDSLRDASITLGEVAVALNSASIERKQAALADVRAKLKTVEAGPGAWEGMAGILVAAANWDKSMTAKSRYEEEAEQLRMAQVKMIESINKMAGAADNAGDSLGKVNKGAGNASVRGPKVKGDVSPGAANVGG
jgi:hypothetical protein